MVTDAWPLLQGTGAATLAWLIAKYVLDHPEPFFAPIAALVALNTSLGERGLNALRLLQGVIVGIAVGELTLLTLNGGYGSLAIAILTATAVARALNGARIAVAQAAVSAILVVALADAGAGADRLIDALIGAGVALVFSQLLFSPEPVRLLRRAETTALAVMADGLSSTAKALEHDDDDELAEIAVTRLRDVRDDLSELGRVRRASTRVARRSLVWRSSVDPVVQEKENAGHLDLLGSSCLVLARTAASLGSAERARLAPVVRELAQALEELAGGLGNRTVRQRAADRSLAVAVQVSAAGELDSPLAAAVMAARMVATDLMVFAGIEPDEAAAAVREGMQSQRVTVPAATPRLPFSWLRWLRMPFSRKI